MYETLEFEALLQEHGFPKEEIKKQVVTAAMAMGSKAIIGDM